MKINIPKISIKRKNILLIKKFLFIYLIISNNLILNIESKIYPDHYEHDDEIFTTSQVNEVTNERFYYSIGYFSESNNDYISPKYGITYHPVKCEAIAGIITYKDDDRASFFGTGKPISDSTSTRSQKNKLEETKLFQNTMKGSDIKCPSPFLLFHNKYFTITYKLPIISISSGSVDIILHKEEDNTSKKICTAIFNNANEYKIIEIEITPKNNAIYGNSIETEYYCKNDNILTLITMREPATLYLEIKSNTGDNIVLSNYRTTIEDKSIKTGVEYQTNFIRSRNGLNTCKEDEDCFDGYICVGNVCLKCHSSCLRCTVDISESNAKNFCKKCNSLSVSQLPNLGICEMGYVEISQFENFEINILPDGNDFNDRETIGFWVFFANTFYSATNYGSIFHVVLKDRLVVSLIPGNKVVRVYCHPFEDIFRHGTSDITLSDEYESQKEDGYYIIEEVPSQEQKQYMQGDDDYNIDGHWFHVTCAESFDHGLFYLKTVINGEKYTKEASLKHETLYNNVENDQYFRHIINDGDYLTLQFKNWGTSGSKIFMRNFILFKEYIPPNMQYMYFNFVGLKDFNEILYQIPFDHLYYGTNFNIKGYKYGGFEEDIKLTYAKNKKEDFAAPLNFKKLEIPPPNKEYFEIDLIKTELKDLEKDVDQLYVYDDNKAMSCKKFLNWEINQCTESCIQYKKIPYQGVSDTTGYCDYLCSPSMVCDYDHLNKERLDYNGDFCLKDIEGYNLFFRCEDNQADYFLQYSGFYNSGQMDLEINPPLQSYIIEFWYYPDFFLNAIHEKVFQYPTYDKNYFFHSNSFNGYFLGTQTTPPVMFDAGNTNDVPIEGYHSKEWNKFIFFTKYLQESQIYKKIIYTNHNMENGQQLTDVSYKDLGQLSYITFCEHTCMDDKQNRIHWTTGYYKNLRIWNADIASPFEIEQYDQNFPSYTDRISSILYFFPMKNEYISNNKVRDPKSKSTFIINTGLYNLRKYNYCSKFDRTAALGYYGKYIDSVTGEEKYCITGCRRCWDVGFCFECKSGYYLQGRKCIKNEYYYFRSPSIVEQSTLNAEIQRITEMESKYKSTVTFWIKTYGFSDDKGISIFNIGKYLEITFSGSLNNEKNIPYGLSLFDKEKLVANDPNFRDKIGLWTFISIAYHKEMKIESTDEVYFPRMMKFEINNESFEINIDNVEKDLELSSFIIKRDFYGLLKDLKFYDDYIIGAVAFEKKKYNLITPFFIPTPVASFFPPGNTNKGCFLTSYLVSATLNDFQCVPDSNDSFDTNACTLSEVNSNPEGKCFNTCMGSSDKKYNWGYCSCTVYNYNSQMIIKNGNKNSCRAFDYINFAKMKNIKIDNVSTAKISKKYTMQFWMYAYNYVNGRFGGITFFWVGHNKLIVKKGSQGSTTNDYEFICIPYATENMESTISQKLIITINQWNFLSCAVDFPGTIYYININTNKNNLILEKSNLDTNEPTNIVMTQTNTYLNITDDTQFDDWGYLFFRQIRLWYEAYFNAEFLSRIKIETKSLFPYLLQEWDPIFIGHKSEDFWKNFKVYELDNSNLDELSFTVNYLGGYGSNIIDENYYDHVILCSENGEYYDVTLGKCVQFTDLSKMKDFQFNNLPSAYSGSYSMAFWIFIEDSSTLSSGIHINWSLHMQITVIKTTRLMGYCFPQGYYTDSISNDNIINKYSSSLNAADVFLVDDRTSESGTWIYVICAMSHYNRKFYINGIDDKVLNEIPLKNEILYQIGGGESGVVRSSAPQRFFMSNTAGLLISTLKIINITNTKKIYFRQITLFRDYISYWYSKELRYMNLAMLDSNNMQSMLFFVNFADFELSTKKLTYYHQYRRKGDTTYVKYSYTTTLTAANEGSTFELSANFNFLPLCEIGSEIKMKYDPEQNKCVQIDSCDLEKLKAYYCMGEDTPLSCYSGQYIDYSNNQISCKTGCSEFNVIRQPGTGKNPGICNSQCPENVQTCPSNNSNNYVSGFVCNGGYYRIAYQCLDQSLDENSALFFSKCYNSPNFYRMLSENTKSKLSYGYYYEFWLKLDHMLTDCKDIPHQSREFYLYSTPHSIYLDTTTNLFYYEISVATSYNTQISGISDYEWNKIIIRTTLHPSIGQNVDIFLNFDFKNPIVSFSGISSSIDMKLLYISFCSRSGSGDCVPNQSSINWGSAYYRNIRVWEYLSSSLEMIQDFNVGIFKELPQSLILYYPLTIRYMDLNKITEIISGTDTIEVTHLDTNNFQSDDNNVFYNYETNFDWGANNLNNYITSLDRSDEKKGFIESAQCHARCKRCYSSSYMNCYECNVGFKLINKECVKINGYYLKIPAKSPNTEIPFSVQKDNLGVPSLKQWTFCIYMKFEGVALPISSYAKIITFKESSYIAFDASTTNLVFVVESKLAFRDTNFNKYIGTWIPMCVANYLSNVPDTYIYPNMIVFNVNKIDIPFVPGYSIPDPGFLIEHISLHYETIALFADFRIYNKFIQHNFATMISSTANARNLFIHYDLYSGQTSCIQLEYLAVNNLISVECVEDYNIYLDDYKFCSGENYFFDVSLSDRDKPCDTCLDNCVTLCNKQDVQECTCDITDGLYWLRKHLTTRRTYCEYLPFIDFSVLNDIKIKVPSSATYESTLEVWFYVYNYNTKTLKFNGIDIIWNKHNRILIYTSNDSIYARCYALWDLDNELRYTEYIEQSVTPYKWNILRCGSEFISHKHSFFFNSESSNLLTEDPPLERKGQYSNLIIKNNELNPDSFGFIFLREMKLWQQYNYHYIDTSRIDLKTYGYYSVDQLKSSGIFPGLISFFKNEFKISEYENVKQNKYYKIINEMMEDTNIFIPRISDAYRKNTFIGYNWVDPENSGLYSELVLCEESMVYVEAKDDCMIPAATHCELPGDALDNCITCNEKEIYINPIDGSCVSECPIGYYPRDDINECRICDITCYTCTGPLYNECTSCSDTLNYVPDLHICILICQDYDLTPSPKTPNLCVIFDADAELVNVKEGIPIDVFTFDYLIGNVTLYTSKNYVTEWHFDATKTRKENNDIEMVFPSETPFNGDITNLNTSIDKNFFELGKKYAIYLKIISENEREPEKTVVIDVPFVLTMNSYPVNGTLIVVPEIGLYNTTTFFASSLFWVDDTTEQLEYKFYAIEKGTSIILNLRDWSHLNEVSSNFTTMQYQNPSVNITIYCEIRDNYNASVLISKEIILANSLINETYNLANAINGYFLPEERTDLICYFRSQYLMSLGLDLYKSIQPARLQTEFQPLLDGTLVIKNDPKCTLDFCNKNKRGLCQFSDYFINCFCQSGFIGRNCQIDTGGYDTLEKYYFNLFDKTLEDLQNTLNYYQFKVFHNLFFSASQFIQDETFFSIKLDTFLELAMSLFPESIYNNTAEYIDLIDFYFSYEVMRLEQFKLKKMNETGLPYLNITLSKDEMEEFKNGFDYIQEELIELGKYIATLYDNSDEKFTYDKSNFFFAVIPLTPTFDDINFFSEREKNYKANVDFMKCLNYIEVQKLSNPFYQRYLIYVEYYFFPFGYDSNLLIKNIAPLVDIIFYDIQTGKDVTIQDCFNENALIFRFPFINTPYLSEFNRQKHLYDPNQYYSPNHPIFRDRIYITPEGIVTDDTVEQRILKYNRLFNISPSYFNEINSNFQLDGINYLNFTNDTNYMIFSASHLSKFTAFIIPNNATFTDSGRFYYLFRPQIFKYPPNFIESRGSLILLIFFGIYIILVISLACYDRKYTDREGLLDFIKEEIIRVNSHYKKNKEDIIKKTIPNKLGNEYDPSFFGGRKKMYTGPRGFDGAMTTGEEIINNELNLDMLNLFKEKNENNLDELNSEKKDENDNKSKKSKKFNNFFNKDDNDLIKPQKLDRKTRTRIQMINEKRKKKNVNELEEEFEDKNEQRENEIQDYVDLSLTTKEFFDINFFSRNIIINALFNISIFHPRWKKLTLVLTEIALITLSISIFLTSYEKVTHKNIFLILLFSLISSLATDILLYLLAFFFFFPPIKFRKLLHLVKEGGELIIIKEWDSISIIQGFKAFFGYLLCIIIWGVSYYVTFGYTVVWKYQNPAFYICLIICFVLEFFALEIIIELINALFFDLRRDYSWMRTLGELLNKIRNYRCLSP